MLDWDKLKAALLGYFKPVNRAFKAIQTLAKWIQQGSITEYIVGFLNVTLSALM